jgi:protein-L-isoaspartate(D-aspartate) O-methyltransferase
MMDLDLRRRFFAEELEAVARLRSSALVDAFATVPREQFLQPGPWTVLSDSGESFMMGSGVRTRTTPDADPAHVYHNIAVAIDPARQLFNGQPGTLGVWLDALELGRGGRALHVGCGLGYYTAVMAECVGPTGRVVAYEVDDALATEARRNLASRPWVDARHGDASGPIDGPFDAILVNAGVTHPLDSWLDALAPGGRMMLPLTASMAAMGSTLGKGLVVLITNDATVRLADSAKATSVKNPDTTHVGAMSTRVVTVVAVYSALGVRAPDMDGRLGKALMAGPARWQQVKRLRRDAHEPSDACWVHGATC